MEVLREIHWLEGHMIAEWDDRQPQREDAGQADRSRRYRENREMPVSGREKLRYDALVRHGGRCQACGRSAKDGVELQVDHVKPKSKFPELEFDIENLQVLCVNCNIGKRNRDETDWRNVTQEKRDADDAAHRKRDNADVTIATGPDRDNKITTTCLDAAKAENGSASDLASALPVGALARSPPVEQEAPKRLSEVACVAASRQMLDEIYEARRQAAETAKPSAEASK